MDRIQVTKNVRSKLKNVIEELDGSGIVLTDMELVENGIDESGLDAELVNLVLFGYDPELKMQKMAKMVADMAILLKRAADELDDMTKTLSQEYLSSEHWNDTSELAGEIGEFLKGVK